jgi:hypothetical protein
MMLRLQGIGLREIPEFAQRMRPTESMVLEETVVASVVIGDTGLIRRRTAEFLGIPFASGSPKEEDGFGSIGSGFRPSVVALLSALDGVDGLIIVGSGSGIDLLVDRHFCGEKLAMSLLDDGGDLSVRQRQAMETMEMCFDLLECLSKNRQSKEDVETDV